MKLSFDYNNGRGHFEVDLTKFFPNTKGNTKRLLEVFQLSENAYELAEKAHGYLVETVKTLQADRAEARLKNNQKKVVSITTEIKKLLSCADVFSSEYGFEVLTDADAESQKMKKVDVYALRTNENGESEIKVVSGYEFKKGGYTFHVYKEKLSKTSRIHIIFPSCGAAVNSNIESIKTFKDAPEFITDSVLKMIDNLLKTDKYKQMTDNFKNVMKKCGYEVAGVLQPIEICELKIKIEKENTEMKKDFELMQDKNGRTMRTGDIVKIEGAYFKNDNGYYFINRAPGDASWSGSDYSLHKIGKRGKISTAKYNISFWPLSSYCSDHRKNWASNEHNKENATIEVIFNINREEVIAHFEKEAANTAKQAEVWKWRFGEESETYIKEKTIAEYHTATAERMKKEDSGEIEEKQTQKQNEEMKDSITVFEPQPQDFIVHVVGAEKSRAERHTALTPEEAIRKTTLNKGEYTNGVTFAESEPQEEQQPELPTDNYFIENMETGKIELHFEKSAYMALSEEQKKEIKSNFLFSCYSSAWVSRCKFSHTYRAKEIAKKLGLADGGKTGETLSFEEQQENKAEKQNAERKEWNIGQKKHRKEGNTCRSL